MELSTITKIYPGLICNGIEIFKDQDNLNIIMDGAVTPFSAAPFQLVNLLQEQIDKEPEAQDHLLNFHPSSSVKRMEQFASCRFGGLDFTPDVKGNTLQDGEYHECPLFNKCAAAGILCKMPHFNGQRLTVLQVKLIKALTTTATNDVIADDLNLCMGTYNLHKKNLYALLEVQTKQEVALIARDLNIVQ